MLTISSVAVSPVPPQAPTVVRVQPTPSVKASDNVSAENQGVIAPVAPAGDGSRVQGVYAPSSLPPVNPTGEAPRINNFNNAATPERFGDALVVSAARAQAQASAQLAPHARTERSTAASSTTTADEPAFSATLSAEEQAVPAAQARAETPRFRGELPPEVKNPAMQAMEAQINDLLPNMWSASRAAVDVLIGEEARSASAARAEVLAGRLSVNADRATEATENYSRTSNLPSPPSTGRTIDRMV